MIRDLAAQEYRALRDAVAARGQLRATLTLAGLLGWMAALTATLVALPYPVASVIPLMVLVATFEVIRPLHTGAERIGRYLQVFFEEAGQGEEAGLAPPACSLATQARR